MKIIIDNENSRSSGLLPGDALSYVYGNYLLHTSLPEQQLLRWCWAAIASGLAKFYHNKTVRQHEVAAMVLGFDCGDYITDDALKERCNVNFKLDAALKAVQCYSHWSIGKPMFERVQFEISCGRPVCCRINWYTGDAHYAVINGFDSQTREIYIQDTLTGDRKMEFDRFPEKYTRSGGAWTETYWTKNQHLN
jgi:hypothetical protein